MDFPIFRKYVGIEVWFRIESSDRFVEIKKIGSKTVSTQVIATIYPEKQFIDDMINCYENRWEPIDEQTYLTALNCSKSTEK